MQGGRLGGCGNYHDTSHSSLDQGSTAAVEREVVRSWKCFGGSVSGFASRLSLFMRVKNDSKCFVLMVSWKDRYY